MAATYGPSGGIGLVLVFDLDNTLIDTVDMESMKADEQLIKDALNLKIINLVLNTAETFRMRYPGSVDAILLLTNNGDSDYVSHVCKVIAEMYQGKVSNFRNIGKSENARINTSRPLFFDYIMMRGNKHRFKDGRNRELVKNMGLVRKMLNALNVDSYNLQERTFFFDDQEHPEMRSQIADGHYIKIIGPVKNGGFIKGAEDRTDYEPILEEFRKLEDEFRTAKEYIYNASANGGPGAYHPGGAPYESNNNNEKAARGGRKRRYRTLKQKSKKRKTIRMHK